MDAGDETVETTERVVVITEERIIGLPRNVVAALAYAAGPFSGAVVVFLHRADDFLRFHGVQSIVVNVALLLLLIVCLIVDATIAWAVEFYWPFLFTIVWLILYLLLTGACMLFAYLGERGEDDDEYFIVPGLGKLAAHISGGANRAL